MWRTGVEGMRLCARRLGSVKLRVLLEVMRVDVGGVLHAAV